MLWNWRKWLFLILLLMWLLFFYSLPPLRLDVFHVLYPKMRREWKYSPALSINIFKYGEQLPISYSGMNSMFICKKKNELSSWDFGISSFVDYMNDVYMPLREEHMNYTTERIVYAKYGSPGIANQMKCACDTLLYALLTNRTFQSMNAWSC